MHMIQGKYAGEKAKAQYVAEQLRQYDAEFQESVSRARGRAEKTKKETYWG